MDGNIKIENANIDFMTGGKTVRVIKDVSITFQEKKITGLIGESGSGKSVLGMSLLRLLPSTARVSGSCRYMGRDLYSLTEREICAIRSKEIGLIPQNPLMALNPVRKIRYQLTESLRVHLGMDRKTAFYTSCENLKQFSFSYPEQIMKQYSFQMSGGMNQRIVSCMGLSCNPKWVIADEPTKGLDAILRKQVYQVLKNVKKNGNSSMIVITHDLQLAEKLCDWIGVLYQGCLVEQGERQQVLQHPMHPYTQGLILAAPSRGMKPVGAAIKGRNRADSECPFYERCRVACEACRDKKIPYKRLDSGQIVRCVRYA